MKYLLQKRVGVLLLLLPLFIFLSFSCNNKKQASTHFLDLSARDTAVRPQDNFFEYANGTWLKNTKIPADHVGWGSFSLIEKKLNRQIKGILDSCADLQDPKEGSPVQQIGALYTSAMDSGAINQKELAPLQQTLSRIQNIGNSNEILNEMTREYKEGLWSWNWYGFSQSAPVLNVFAFADEKNSNVARVHCYQGGLGLPNKNYYFPTDSTGKALISAYKKYISRLLSMNDDKNNARADADSIYGLEKKLAQASKSPVELQDREANYHLMTIMAFNHLTPNINWIALFNQMGIQPDSVIVGQPGFYKALSGLLKSEPLSLWKKYFTFHLLNHFSAWLSKPFEKAGFEFSQQLTGVQKQKPRWERATQLVNNTLGDALGQIYVKEYFPPSSKKYMKNMVDHIEQAYRQHIKKLTWMSDSTKTKALAKLGSVVKKIGYPDKWKDYSSVTVKDRGLIENLKRIGQWYYHYNMAKLDKPVDRSEWFMTPTTVNAYYNGQSNDINFPAGILQPPFYFKNGDDAINYGGIGMVISHEITHGFDNEGSKFDKDGNMKNWWTKEDRKRFEKRAEGIVHQYSHYSILDTLHLNGKLGERENIADVGGLSIAYSAFKHTKEGQSDTLINGLPPDKRFFLSFAQIWRVKFRPKTIALYVHIDPHSPPIWRVNGPLSDLDAFYKIYHVKPGDKMYRPDSLRVSLW